MAKGIFTISLDFELFWGVRDHRTLENYGSNIMNVHNVVPRLLELFSSYEVHCTWATVGFLFLHNKKELLAELPSELPAYLKKEYDPYSYLKENELDPVYHFAPALIDHIKRTKGQEIGTHTYSHFYTLEKNTNGSQFREDIRTAMKVSSKNGVQVKSIVFPRNQYSEEHLRICKELGITTYRGNEESGYYRPVSREQNSNWRRGVRLLDTFFNLTGHHCHPIPPSTDIMNVPASRFLRPHSKKLAMFDRLKFSRISNSIQYAANKGLIFHIWWHPHNFGRYMDKNFAFLEKILKVYKQLKGVGKMESLNMNEIYQRTSNQ